VILGMPWLTCYNPEIDWRTGKINMMSVTSNRGQYRENQNGRSKRKKRQKKKLGGREKKEIRKRSRRRGKRWR